MSTVINRQFLDYNGLATFWDNIQNKFATQTAAIKTGEFVADTNNIRFHPTQADGTAGTAIDFPMADHDNAGAISSEIYNTIVNLEAGEGGLVPIIGVQINGTDVNLNNRKANIKLEYTEEGEKSYLSLVDASPSNAEGVSIAISKIDVTSFVKTGLIESAEYDSKELKIRLTFHTYKDGVAGKDVFEIPVADLIDEYIAGTGISIDNRQNRGDSAVHQSEISVKRAQLTERGAIRIAKANDIYNVNTKTSNIDADISDTSTNSDRFIGVEVDKTDKAFVYVPWYNTNVVGESNGSHGLILSSNNSTLTNTISLGANTIASLDLADNAVQTLKIVNKEVSQNVPEITKTEFEEMLDLKSASHVNTIKNANFKTNTDNDTDIPTCAAVAKYVLDTKTELIESLDSNIEAGLITVTSNYTDEYQSRDVKQFYTAIKIADGDLVNEGADYISIYDIADFYPLSNADINRICGVTQ